MRIIARLILVLYMLALITGLGYWWYVWQIHDGMPPHDEALGRWAIANPWAFDFSFSLVAAQFTCPVFWWLTRKIAWTGLWRVLRNAHIILVLSVLLLLMVLLLATPDVSGFTS